MGDAPDKSVAQTLIDRLVFEQKKDDDYLRAYHDNKRIEEAWAKTGQSIKEGFKQIAKTQTTIAKQNEELIKRVTIKLQQLKETFMLSLFNKYT